jgi:hypothetical protein
MERVGGRYEKMEGHCSTTQSPQWAVVPMEEEEEEEEENRPVDELLLLFLEQTPLFVIDTVFEIIYLEKYYYCSSILFL